LGSAGPGAAPGAGPTAPSPGGATPSIVPFSGERAEEPGAAGDAPETPGAGGGTPGDGPAGPGPGVFGRGTPPDGALFIISIVPLNFGAAVPLRLNPHFLQVFDTSSFSVPQFGQNTRHLRLGRLEPRKRTRPASPFSTPKPIIAPFVRAWWMRLGCSCPVASRPVRPRCRDSVSQPGPATRRSAGRLDA
jgi:hypothetical protein